MRQGCLSRKVTLGKRARENCVFQPEEIAVMISAYERVACELTLADDENRESTERIA